MPRTIVDPMRPYARPVPPRGMGRPGLGAVDAPVGIIPGLSLTRGIAALAVNWFLAFGALYLAQEAGWDTRKQKMKAALVISSGITLVNNVLIPFAAGVGAKEA